MEMIQNKIAYHNLQIFSLRERFGADSSFSQNRIKELEEIRESLQKTLRQAEELGLAVDIDCPINVRLTIRPTEKNQPGPLN